MIAWDKLGSQAATHTQRDAAHASDINKQETGCVKDWIYPALNRAKRNNCAAVMPISDSK